MPFGKSYGTPYLGSQRPYEIALDDDLTLFETGSSTREPEVDVFYLCR